MYEPISVEIDRACGDGTYRSHKLTFTGRLVGLIEEGYTTMRLYEWVDRGRLVYLVQVEEHKPGRPPRRTLYPFVNTHLERATPTKGYTAEEVARAYPESLIVRRFWDALEVCQEGRGAPEYSNSTVRMQGRAQ